MSSTDGVNGVDPFKSFVEAHLNQLETSVVPKLLWSTLYEKLSQGIFDAGSSFSLLRIENDDGDFCRWKVIVNCEGGIKTNDAQNIFLVDHAWTFRPENARQNLEQIDGLLGRMADLMDVELADNPAETVEKIMEEKWKFAQTYSVGNAQTIEDRMPIWYIMDEFGSRVQNGGTDSNFRLVPFLSLLDGVAYSLLFPIKDCDNEDEVTRDYLEGPEAQNERVRKALMNIWTEEDMTDVDWHQVEPWPQYFIENRQVESWLEPEDFDDVEKFKLPEDRRLKVYAEYAQVREHLHHPRFEIVDSPDQADILWLMTHFKEFKELTEMPAKRINQFAFEHLLTIKDLLCIVCRRKGSEIEAAEGQLETAPDWLPTTFNMKTELAEFVSYFQRRQRDGLDNHWIVKPWNLARALDTHVTANLSHILKLPLGGPKIAQKYISDPVLFERPEVGRVKFDVRYIVLLQSVRPLKVYVYDRFWLRFANKPFELAKLDEYERHFTVMNYNEAHLEQMFCHDFVKQFESQYPEQSWAKVEESIFHMLKSVFEAATEFGPPRGIGHSPQSRAMYACDLMLAWEPNSSKPRRIVPKILELNWGPDCERACDYYPEFFDNVFSTLYLDHPDDQNVTLL